MALAALDSDSEFGYDFSVEEEELLLQLAAKNPQPLHPPNYQSKFDIKDKATLAIDSVPGKTESIFGDDHIENDNLQTSGSESTETLRFHTEKRPVNSAPSNLPTLAPAASIDQDISYPDCMYSASSRFRETN